MEPVFITYRGRLLSPLKLGADGGDAAIHR